MGANTRPAPRAYRTQVTMRPVETDGKPSEDAYLLWSIPYPIHAARIAPRGRDGLWRVEFYTIPMAATLTYHLFAQAKDAASERISRQAGIDLMRFNGAQRTAMGQQRCPKQVNGRLCDLAPMPGTVWCEWHPFGQWRNDA